MDTTKESVLLNKKLTAPEQHTQTLSLEQWNKLRAAHQMLASGGMTSPKLPLMTPQDRAMSSWTAQLDALTHRVEAIADNCEVLKGIAGTGQPLPGLTPGLPIGLNPGNIPVAPQAG